MTKARIQMYIPASALKAVTGIDVAKTTGAIGERRL
jgi:hypothetical protein